MRSWKLETWLACTVLFFFCSGAVNGKAAERPRLRAGILPDDLRVDGRLDEPAWAEADSIPNLTAFEPREGVPPAERTLVRVLAGPKALAIGVICEDSGTIVSFAKERDARLDREDHVKIVLDTFLDGRSGYVFAVNAGGARYDALVTGQGARENSNWDEAWEAATARYAGGWSVEIKIPIQSLGFKKGLREWGFNVQRRVQRLQETSRWAGAKRDYEITRTSRAGRLVGLPDFSLGLGLSLRPAGVSGLGSKAPHAATDVTRDVSFDASQRLGPNLTSSLTIRTDFAETEVDTRQTNLTRFSLFFPEKRTFFLQGADLFDFGPGLGRDIIPFFSRRIGLLQGREAPLNYGGKLNGRIGNTNIGMLAARTGAVAGLTPAATMSVVRLRQNVLRESSMGIIATTGDPRGRTGSWMAGADFTYQTSHFRGDKNFLVGAWGLRTDRENLEGDKSTVGFKADYPNDLWNISFTYKRIGDGFRPSLSFVPRPGVQRFRLGADYSPRPDWPWVRQMFFESSFEVVTALDGQWESYRVFTAPVNWRLESGDRFEFNVVPQGENLFAPFEVAEGVVIPPGPYHWRRFRAEGGFAAKRKLSGQITSWFGGFYDGMLYQFEGELAWNPAPLFTLELSGESDVGRLPEGNFTQNRTGTRFKVNISPDLQINSFLQYDNETQSLGSNTRLRWTFNPLGDLFVVWNYNVREIDNRFVRDSYQFLTKVQYTFRY